MLQWKLMQKQVVHYGTQETIHAGGETVPESFYLPGSNYATHPFK